MRGMQVTELIHGVGSVGPFQSRVFIPALATALVLRFGPEISWVQESGILEDVVGGDLKQLSWFTSDLMLWILGALSVLEVTATKSPDARALLGEVEQYLKPGMAALSYMGVVSTIDAQKMTDVLESAPAAAGVIDALPALMVGAATWVMVAFRRAGTADLIEADEDDDAGIQGLFSWANDIWAFFGIWLLVIVPLLIIALTGLLVLLFVYLKRRAHQRDEQSKIPCSNCSEPVYSCALACGNCGEEVGQPHEIGFFGQALTTPAADRENHQYRLVEKKRCPVCATRLTKRDPKQTCERCGHRLMHEPGFAKQYSQRIAARIPAVLAIGAALSLIPIIGLIPGVIAYRLALVAPFRRYVPRLRSAFTRWGIRLLFLVLVFVQIVPGVNAIVVPIMAMVNYLAYRGQFQRLLDRTPPPDSGLPAPGNAAAAG